jgi:hypothetical protein
VVVAALAGVALLPSGLEGPRGHLVLLLVLSAFAGMWPVRIASLRTQFTATDPVLLCSLALLGPRAAVFVGIVAVVGAAVRRRPTAQRLVFNVSAVTLSVVLSWWTFVLFGGTPGAETSAILVPLLAATTAYFICNTALVTAAISFERGTGAVDVWRRSCRWTASTYFTSLSLAVAFFALMNALGAWALLLTLPPCWMIAGFNRSYQARLDEQQLRIQEVEELNAELSRTIDRLTEANEHVRQLQGLLPLCMHCKNVRDDADSWQRIEAYLAKHTDLRVTHSLCQTCAREHYPEFTRCHEDEEEPAQP